MNEPRICFSTGEEAQVVTLNAALDLIAGDVDESDQVERELDEQREYDEQFEGGRR